MLPDKHDLSIYRGGSYQITLDITNNQGQVVDLTGYTLARCRFSLSFNTQGVIPDLEGA